MHKKNKGLVRIQQSPLRYKILENSTVLRLRQDEEKVLNQLECWYYTLVHNKPRILKFIDTLYKEGWNGVNSQAGRNC